MKKIILSTLSILSFSALFSQVGIGTTSPDASAALEISSTNKGFLPPRIGLTSTSDVTTITSPATGLLIYNTTVAGVFPNNVLKGYYFFNGAKWMPLGYTGYATVIEKTSNYTLTESDTRAVIVVNSSSAVTITVPNTLSTGYFCQIIQKGTGQVTVVGSGATLKSARGFKTRVQNSSIGIMMESSAVGYISGDSSL
jgi:hypothetical protein